jgi:hypothetical protein
MSTMSLRVVGSPPDRLAFSIFFDLRQGHVRFSVTPGPIAAHLAARVAHEGAVENQHRRMYRPVLRHGRAEEVAGSAESSLGDVLRGVDLCHVNLRFYKISG